MLTINMILKAYNDPNNLQKSNRGKGPSTLATL